MRRRDLIMLVVTGLSLPASSVSSTFNQKPFNESPYILKFNKAECRQRLNGATLFGHPYELFSYGVGRYVAAGGDLYRIEWDAIYMFATDPGWDRIVYGRRGSNVIRCYGGGGECGDGAGVLDQPTSIDIAPNGTEQSVYVFVADTGNDRIVVLRFDESTEQLSFVKELVDPAYPLDQPFGVSWDHGGTPFDFSNDYVWVADTGNHRIVKFHVATSTVVAAYDTFEDINGNEATLRYPQGIASFKQFGYEQGGPYGTAGERLFVADTGNKRMLRFIEHDGVLDIEDDAGFGYAFDSSTAPDVVSPNARFICVDVDANGALYVTDKANSRVYKLKYHQGRSAAGYIYPILPLKVYGFEGRGDTPGAFLHPKSMSVMRGRVLSTGGTASWMSYDDVFTVEDWTDDTGGQRHQLGVEAEILDIDVYPGTSVAEFSWLTTEYSLMSTEIRRADGTLVRTLWPGGPTLLEAGVRTVQWDGKDEAGQDCPQGDYVLRVTSQDWLTEEGEEFEVALDEKTFTFPDPIPQVVVTSPNGGEFWEVGSTQEITWDIPGEGPAGQILVYLCWNDGRDSQLLAALGPEVRGYVWENVDIAGPPLGFRIKVKAYYEGQTAYKEDYSDAGFSICSSNTPSASTSSVWEQPSELAYRCPAGDAGSLMLGVRLKNCLGDPVAAVPAEGIVAVVREDSTATAIACTATSFKAEYTSDAQGETRIVIPELAGCGDLTFDVYAQGALIGQETVSVRSPDYNGDCVVDAEDQNILFDYLMTGDLCEDLDGGGLGQSDIGIFNEHFAGYHFSIHPGYSSANVAASDPDCMVLCPKGDMESLSTLVIARNAHNAGFPYSSIPADSIWAELVYPLQGEPPDVPPEWRLFRFICRPDCTRATADSPTWGPEKTTITINSGGGHHEQLSGWQGSVMEMFIGGQKVGEWGGLMKSPDIDASGAVNGTDVSIWADDNWACNPPSWMDPECHFRSDLDCNGTVGYEDFDVLNHHYKHKCGASSQMMVESHAGPSSWTADDAARIRSHLPNYVLDELLSKDLHPELRGLLTRVRSLEEPDSLAALGGEVRSAAISLLPQVTSIAQNVPNPFTGTAVISYQVAPPGGQVKILIFDVAGRRVRTLVDKGMAPGFYSVPWDGRSDEGRRLPSGVYFYQMKAPGFASNKRMLLVR